MYKALVAIIRFVVKLFWGFEINGAENIPEKGGAIVAANHVTWFDPLLVGAAITQPIHFMGKAELFTNPILGRILPKLHVFPIKRGGADRGAIRQAQKVVTGGSLLGIFPEGTRNRGDNELLPLQGGTAFIALKTGVPVIPVVVKGVKPLRFRRAIKVTIGKPIHLGRPQRTNKQEVERASNLISSQFSELISRNN